MNAPEHLDSPADDLSWLAFLYVSEELTPDEMADFEERLLTDQAAREAVAKAMKMTEGLWMATALESQTEKPLPADPSLQTSQTSQKKLPKAGCVYQKSRWPFGVNADVSIRPPHPNRAPPAGWSPPGERGQKPRFVGVKKSTDFPETHTKAGWRRVGWIVSSVIAAGLAFSVGWWMGQPGDSSKPAVPEVSESDIETPRNGTPLLLSEVEGTLQLVEIWSDAQSLVDELAVGLAVAERADDLEEPPADESAEPDEEAFAWMLAAITSDAGSGANAPQDEPAVMEN